jgi:hypothetical protein
MGATHVGTSQLLAGDYPVAVAALSGCQSHGSSVRSSWLLVRPETVRCKT